jgi:hypothetical protein
MAKLVVLTEGFVGASYELKVERTTIGRVEDNAFPIPEPSVSAHHCEVLLRGNEIVVRDLNSTNGTFVNGEPIKESVLKPGQILRLGQVELRLSDGAGAASPARHPLDHTAVIAAGVKLDELGHTSYPVGGSPFAKKSDKTGKFFLYGGVVFGVLILGLILYVLFFAL